MSNNEPLATKLVNGPRTQVVVSPSGEPAYLQIPWEVFETLSGGELETLEILSDPWWSKELPRRLHAFKKNPKRALRGAISLEQFRDKIGYAN